MYKVSCKDLGDDTCVFEASGESKEEVVGTMVAHAKEVHAEKVKEMMEENTEEDVKKMMMDAVREA